MTQATPLISLSGINFQIDGSTLLHDVNFEIYPSEIVTLIGPNGAGKTTLIKIIAGLLKPKFGSIAQNKPLTMGYVPQHFHINNNLPMSVSRFLSLQHNNPTWFTQVVADLAIEELLDYRLNALSGGQLRRILLARAILKHPDILILDEPTTGVDFNGQAELHNLITKLRDDYGFAVLMVSHELYFVMAATNRVLCLGNGHICCSGQPDAVSKHPEYLALFGDQIGHSIAVYTHHHDHQHDLSGNEIPLEHDDCEHNHHG
ncbi:MAG: metal ABC transporter ATP-binding protein [Gammaproteobacteria bacterium]|nr:metal ABC transporter ATP-binding protein [Gammaproteobacteria bacterium]